MSIRPERIKSSREAKNMSQAELANQLEISSAAICQYEGGTKNPSIKTLQKLSEILEVSTDYLIGEEIEQTENIEALFRGLDKMDDDDKNEILGEMQNFYQFLKSKKKSK